MRTVVTTTTVANINRDLLNGVRWVGRLVACVDLFEA